MSLFRFTGNPFVDTGLCIVAHLVNKPDPGSIDIDDLRNALDSGDLARWNSRLKSFTMIFGKNGPLVQNVYRHVDRNKLYTDILRNILNQQHSSSQSADMCDLCGTLKSIDITHPFNAALQQSGLNEKESKVISRELIPMTGSLGKSAQSLPGSIQAVKVCARCFTAINFLPLGSQLLDKRLIVFDCANQPLTFRLVRRIVDRNTAQLQAGNSKVETLGNIQRPESLINGLIDIFAEIDSYDKDNIERPLYLWQYSNSGTNPSCELLEIPNYAIGFIWEAVNANQNYRADLENIIRSEYKLPCDRQLLSSLRNRRFHRGLMPRKGYDGPSLGLAQLYLNHICGVQPETFTVARRIAKQCSNHKEFDEMKKDGSFRLLENKANVRGILAYMAETGELSLDEYNTLFPTVQKHPIRIDQMGWDILRLHMCKLDEADEEELEATPPMGTLHPKIEEASQLYFNDYVQDRGLARFKSDVLNRFNSELGVPWLRNRFASLAEKHPGFNYGDWDEFVCDENGKPQAYELLFQMRLCLANLYRERMQEIEEGKK